jgi:hypothetical protein
MTSTDTSTTAPIDGFHGQPLTSEDIAALKDADSVVFRLTSKGSSIEAGLRKYAEDGPVIFTAREQRLYTSVDHYSPTERSRIISTDVSASGYGDGTSGGWRWNADNTSGRPDCFEMIGSARYLHTLGTILVGLRAGDVVTLVWTADNNTDNYKAVGFHADELTLVAIDPTGKRPERTWLVAYSVGPDNTARMIRRHG